jgi:hypothetical protein
VEIDQQPTYKDVTGATFPWSAANAIAAVTFQIGQTVLSAEAAPPLKYNGSDPFTSGPQFLNTDSGPLHVSVTPNAPVALTLTASISGGGVFSGFDKAFVDPTGRVESSRSFQLRNPAPVSVAVPWVPHQNGAATVFERGLASVTDVASDDLSFVLCHL